MSKIIDRLIEINRTHRLWDAVRARDEAANVVMDAHVEIGGVRAAVDPQLPKEILGQLHEYLRMDIPGPLAPRWRSEMHLPIFNACPDIESDSFYGLLSEACYLFPVAGEAYEREQNADLTMVSVHMSNIYAMTMVIGLEFCGFIVGEFTMWQLTPHLMPTAWADLSSRLTTNHVAIHKAAVEYVEGLSTHNHRCGGAFNRFYQGQFDYTAWCTDSVLSFYDGIQPSGFGGSTPDQAMSVRFFRRHNPISLVYGMGSLKEIDVRKWGELIARRLAIPGYASGAIITSR